MSFAAPVLELWDIDKVVPYQNNAKNHDSAQIAKIAEAITLTGWDQPIVVDADGVIIKGHGRRAAAQMLNMLKVPVIVRRDLSVDQIKAARLADNRVAIGNYDTDKLRLELAELAATDFKMDKIFDAKELDFFGADLGAMNLDPFVSDLPGALDAQDGETKAAIVAAAAGTVPIWKALGFKTITGAAERAVVAFMASVEQSTGLKGEAAFCAFAATVTKEQV